jgi:hypothetical protein
MDERKPWMTPISYDGQPSPVAAPGWEDDESDEEFYARSADEDKITGDVDEDGGDEFRDE